MNESFIKQAVDLSRESMGAGKFPAGAVIARGDEALEIYKRWEESL